ncbi:methylated-DNA--[protein]-cysteine S-methyltransferase [Tepidamorphus sp. 3E244]|uniref:methylated-DNA--[protein]-cysteine S-methyltransferase n=1 Tax=Tepidamorphus sp. 3E244 TaxID=3385498 RepID=UPI0038FC7866
MTAEADTHDGSAGPDAADDYARVRAAIRFLTENWRDQPDLDTIAEEMGLNPTQAQKLFHRWAGLTPKQFVQAITLDTARSLLSERETVLDTTYDVGLSGPGRLHDLFVSHEAMTPGEYRNRGAGLEISYGFQEAPFGLALVLATARGLCGLAFCDGEGGRDETLADMTRRWPAATFVEDAARTAPYAARVFKRDSWSADTPLRVVMIGSDFEVRVWETLLKIPFGKATTYGDIAKHLGKPSAARAVGAAVGRNPISFVVPCHRVLGKSGALTGYHWGLTRKRAILGWESGLV